jgi:hypothetical protein
MPAVGTCVVTTTDVGMDDQYRLLGIVKYSFAWTAHTDGTVSGHATAVKRGHLVMAKVVPGTGGDVPSASYGVTLVDTDGVDVMGGQGASQSASVGHFYPYDPQIFFDGSETLDLVVSAAGSGKKGTVHLWVK